MIVYPLTYRDNDDKIKAIKRMIELTKEINDDKQKVFILRGLWVFCDKVISNEDADEIRRMLMLTKVEQIYEREKQEAVEEATKRVTERVTESVTVTVTQDVTDRIARNLLNDGYSPESVASNTGLSLSEVFALMKKSKG